MPQRLSLISIVAKNLPEERQFLEEGLGWAPVQAMPGIVFYQLNGLVFGLMSEDTWAQEGLAAPPPGPASIAVNFASKAEVDSLMTRAVAAGAKCLKKPKEVYWGGYSGYFSDPAGHYWEVAFIPYWQIDARGHTIARPA